MLFILVGKEKKEKAKGKKKRKLGHLIVAPMAVKPQPCDYSRVYSTGGNDSRQVLQLGASCS